MSNNDNKPEWIVNSIGELGVKIGNRFFFLYKGRSLEYDMKDEPMKWRPVYKREFGEVCHPENYSRAADGVYSFGDDWKDIPKPKRPQCETCFQRSSKLLEESDFIECRECGKVVKDRYGLEKGRLPAAFSKTDSSGTQNDKLNALHTYTLNSVVAFKQEIKSLKEQVEVLTAKLVEETLEPTQPGDLPQCPDHVRKGGTYGY